MSSIHILNGDALNERFPIDLKGERIIARACLVDGPVKAASLEELFALRAQFLAHTYGVCTEEEYQNQTVTGFKKIQGLSPAATIYLWFEDDLFCQVNCWFVCYLLAHYTKVNKVFLVRPKEHSPYGFGKYTSEALYSLYQLRTPLQHLNEFAQLWEYYQSGAFEALKTLGEKLSPHYPFLPQTIQVQLDRIPQKGQLDRPTQSVLSIMKELNTTDFAPVFQAFCQRESRYGFGDLQVKRIFDQALLLKKKK